MTLKDEARVLTTAGRFGGEAYRRFNDLKGLIRTGIVENDALRIGQSDTQGLDLMASAPTDFTFEENADKQQAFERWLSEALDDEVLEPASDSQIADGAHWSGKYVRGARNSGLRDAGTRLREAGIEPEFSRDELESLFNAPVSREQLGTLYQRAFSELKGINSAASQQISRELADGLEQGESPRKVASRINDRVDKIGITRARTLARTETARSYQHASLLRYEEFNSVNVVDINNVSPCSLCAPYVSGGPYKIDDAYGILPIHPNCLGVYIPRTDVSAGSVDSLADNPDVPDLREVYALPDQPHYPIDDRQGS